MKPPSMEAAAITQAAPQGVVLSGHWTARGIGAIEAQLDGLQPDSTPGTVADGTRIIALDTAEAWVLQELLVRLRVREISALNAPSTP